MNYVVEMLAGSLPMGVMIFVGSYFGLWRRNTVKLPRGEVFWIFIGAWLLAVVLLVAFQVMLAGQDAQLQQDLGGLWAPLIVGVLIGRKVTSWRREKLKRAAGTAPVSAAKG